MLIYLEEAAQKSTFVCRRGFRNIHRAYYASPTNGFK